MERQGALITISQQELQRYRVLELVLKGDVMLGEAAKALEVSYRHAKRLRARAKGGLHAMAHGNRGREPSNKTDISTKALVLTLSQEKYSSFNDAHFTEQLALEGGDTFKPGDGACDKEGGGDSSEAEAQAEEASSQA